MVKSAKILHQRGFFITFFSTDCNHRRLLRSGDLTSLDSLPGWRFVSIPDGLPPSDANATQDIPAICDSARSLTVGPFLGLVEKLNKETGYFPGLSYRVGWFRKLVTSQAAKKFGIPLVNLFTISACSLLAFKNHRVFLEKCIKPLKVFDAGDPDKIVCNGTGGMIDWIPGLKNMRPCDMPYFFGATDEDEDTLLSFIMEVVNQSHKVYRTILHTFEKLESDALDTLSSMILNICRVGPLHLLLEKIPLDESVLKHVRDNLWEDHAECLEWLDTKGPGSVLYLNFGSIAFLTHEQLVEFVFAREFGSTFKV